MRTITSLQYDCLGLVLIRVPLYMENHATTVGSHCSAITTKPLRGQIKPLRKITTHEHLEAPFNHCGASTHVPHTDIWYWNRTIWTPC